MSQNPRWKASQEQHVTLTSGFTYNYVQTYTNVQKHVFTPTNKKTIKGLDISLRKGRNTNGQQANANANQNHNEMFLHTP